MRSGRFIQFATAAIVASTVAIQPASSAPTEIELPQANSAPAPHKTAAIGGAAIRAQAFPIGNTPASAPADALVGSTNHFPDLRDMNLIPPPLPPRSTDSSDQAGSLPRDQAVVPLPSGAWNGMALLAILALVGSRKAIYRFLQ